MKRALMSLVTVLLALAACELLLRLTLPRDRFSGSVETTYRPDPVMLYAHVPGSTGHSVAELPEDGFDVHYRYDQHGMRGHNDFLDDPRPDRTTPRVMLLGDSYVEQRQLGDGDLIQTRLERLLSQGASPAPRVFAYGVSGWSPIEYTLYYKTQARGFRPTVLFVFLTFNDYRDDALAAARCQFDDAGELLACPASIDDYRNASHRPGPSFSMLLDLYRRAKKWRASSTRGLRELLYGSYREEGSEDLLGILDARRIDSNLPRVHRSFGFLKELFDAARGDGVRPVLVIIPWPQQVGAQEWALGRGMWGVAANRRETSTVFQDLTVRAARQAGIDTLDLLPVLREGATRDRMFFPFDGHFTPAAARLVATALANAVLSLSERPKHDVAR